jgi:dTDP-glucose 4,6-dehydratase
MKFLIYGGKGWIGKQFISLLKEEDFILSNVRVDSYKELEKEIQEVNPTHLISFIGRTSGEGFSTIDYLEQKGKLKENINDNLYGPLILAKLSEVYNIHFTYLGTGCIFTYSEDKDIFTEKDDPNFFGSSYSTVKGFTDKIMKIFSKNTLNVRIRMPIIEKPHPKNFITKITSYDKICSIPNSMTVLPELLPYLLKLIQRNYTGTIHLTNPGVISHNEILEMYRDIIDPTFEWKNMTIEEQNNLLLSERSNNYLRTDSLESLFPEILPIKESIRNCLEIYKQYSSIKNILVTGGCGFIGSHFINIILSKYPHLKIVNIDAMYYCACKENIKENIRNSSNYTFIEGNITSSELISHILKTHQIDTIIHFAAQSHVQHSFSDSLLYTKDNILGTHTLLEECRKHNKIKKFIHISTDEVYGSSMLEDDPKHEHSILCPTNPYAATKAGAELIAQSYYHSFQFPLIITRGNNVYGENQYPEKVIPRFLQLRKDGKKLTIQGDGSNLRSFLHINDVISALELILYQGKIGEIYNIGSDEEISIQEVAKMILKYEDSNIDIENQIEYIEDRPFNDTRYYVTNDKLKLLGWEQKISFKDGLYNLWRTTKNKII